MSKRIEKALAFGLMILLVLSTGAFVVAKQQCPYVAKRLVREILRQPYTPSREIEFRWKMSASGTTPDGARFDDSHYLTSDCVTVTVTYYSFSSPGIATEHFDGGIRTARTVYGQDSTRDVEGNLTDQRAVLSVRSQGL